MSQADLLCAVTKPVEFARPSSSRTSRRRRAFVMPARSGRRHSRSGVPSLQTLPDQTFPLPSDGYHPYTPP